MSKNINKKFGRLTILIVKKIKNYRYRCLCKCDCGTKKWFEYTNILSGKSKSCGCLRTEQSKERFTIHGHSQGHYHTHTYSSWSAMKNRCYNKKNPDYPDYGGRGIKVCKRWLVGENGKHPFECFFNDMGARPKGRSLDRFPNNDGNYEPENCRWATNKQQRANRRPIRKKIKHLKLRQSCACGCGMLARRGNKYLLGHSGGRSKYK